VCLFNCIRKDIPVYALPLLISLLLIVAVIAVLLFCYFVQLVFFLPGLLKFIYSAARNEK